MTEHVHYLCLGLCQITIIISLITIITVTITINFYRQCESNAIRIYGFNQFGLFESVLVPNAVYVTQTLSGAFTNLNKREHIKDSSVSRIADTAGNSLVNSDTESARVCNSNLAEFFVDDDSTTAIVIRVNQSVRQALSERLVNWSVIYTLQIGIELEGNLDVCSQTVNNLEVEIEYVTTPVSVSGAYSVRPARFS